MAGGRETGFPSPAAGEAEGPIDLAAELAGNPTATFLLRAKGDGMAREGVEDGDLLVVDRSLAPAPGRLAVVVLDGSLAVRRLRRGPGGLFLADSKGGGSAAPSAHPSADLEEGVRVWGVVRHLVRTLVRGES